MERQKNYTGKGIVSLSKRKTYEGDFVNGLPDGLGKMEFSNYDQYEGSWCMGRMEGFGTYRFYDHTRDIFIGKYEGGFKNSFFHGLGQMTYPDGSIYYGNWLNGHKEGSGQLFLPAIPKRVFSGRWENDVLTEGAYIEEGGIRYVGEFLHYRFSGKGILFLNDGSWLQGKWGEDELVDGNAFLNDGTLYAISDKKIVSARKWK